MSSGAVLSLDAADRGLAVTKLALYEPPFMVDDSRPPVPEDYRERLTAMLSEGRRGDAVELFMTEAVGVPAEAVSPMRGAPFWPGLESVAHTLPYDDAIMGDLTSGKPLPAARWAGVTIPTLVIDGGESPAWARNAVQAIVDVLPQAERRTLDGQTHQVDPEVLAPLLDEFLRRLRCPNLPRSTATTSRSCRLRATSAWMRDAVEFLGRWAPAMPERIPHLIDADPDRNRRRCSTAAT